MTDDEHEDATEYGLIMPFTVTASHGGPYEDQAFIAGYQAGQVDQSLAAAVAIGVNRLVVTVYTPLVPQIELIGMKHGFTGFTAEKHAAELAEWSLVTLERPHGCWLGDAEGDNHGH